MLYAPAMRLALLLLLLAPAAHATEPAQLRYAVYAGGLNVVVLHSEMRLSPRAYQVRLLYRTAGLYSLIVGADLETTVSGRFVAGRAVPYRFYSAGRLRGIAREVLIDYVNGIPVVRRLIPPLGPKREPVPPAEETGTVDTLSAMAQMAEQVNETQRCDGAMRVFDGRRLIALSAKTIGLQVLPPSNVSTFSGEALRCDVISQQLAGFKHDQDEARLRRPQRGEAWFGRLVPGGPLVLVRATFPTIFFGHGTMYLQSRE